MALPVDLLLSRTELPQDGARLNPAHPLAGRFVTAYLPGVSSDNLGFGGPGGITGNAHSRSAIPAGPTLRLSGSGANATTSRSFGPTPSYPLTMVVVCRQGSTGNGTITALAAASGIGGSYWFLGGGSSSQVSLAARNNFGTALSLLANVPADSGGNQALNQDLVIVAQSLSASDHRLVINGGTIATSTTNIGSLVAWDRLFFGQSGGTTNLDVAALLFAHGGTALTDAQMRQLSSHPREVWELFEPQRLPVLTPAAAGGQTVSITAANETDTAQALAVVAATTAAITAANETDAAQPLAALASRTVAVGQVSETSTAQALTVAAGRVAAIVAANESDVAQSLTTLSTRTVPVGQAAEADAAQTLTAQPGQFAAALGAATESDLAQPAAVIRVYTGVLGQATEGDTAQPFAPATMGVVPIAQAAELAAALPIAASTAITLPIAQTIETCAAQAFSVVGPRVVPIGAALELDLALPLGAAVNQTVGLGLATSVETASALTSTIRALLGTASELDAPLGLNLALTMRTALELGAARAVTPVVAGMSFVPRGSEQQTIYVPFEDRGVYVPYEQRTVHAS